MDAALDRAQAAFKTRSRTPVTDRCAIFAKASSLVLDRAEDGDMGAVLTVR